MVDGPRTEIEKMPPLTPIDTGDNSSTTLPNPHETSKEDPETPSTCVTSSPSSTSSTPNAISSQQPPHRTESDHDWIDTVNDQIDTYARTINTNIIDPSKQKLHSFFFPASPPLDQPPQQNKAESFWRAYDDIIILSLATQIGILFRILSSSLLKLQNNPTFHENSSLFTNLPLNVISCFIMGIFVNGEGAWESVKRGGTEWRNVQIDGLKKRLRRCEQSVVLFMAKREEEDFMEHYSDEGDDELTLLEEEGEFVNQERLMRNRKQKQIVRKEGLFPETVKTVPDDLTLRDEKPIQDTNDNTHNDDDDDDDNNNDNENKNKSKDEIINTLVSVAHGWDINTTPIAMSDDLMLGLRVGFCGALSSFSSWNSEMVNLLRNGMIGQALMGYTIGLSLPILAYKLGVYVAIYTFVWRSKRQARREARRGYYGRTSLEDEDVEAEIVQEPSERPSVRAFATAFFILALVAQLTSIIIFDSPKEQQFAYSLLFSPLGVLCRWKLNKYNSVLPSFPLGTFSANLLSCALSGSLGSLLTGNPGSEERIVLQSLISGFAGSLSTLALFVVQVLERVDPILFRYDGFVYGFVMIFWGMVIGFVTRQAKDWADDL